MAHYIYIISLEFFRGLSSKVKNYAKKRKRTSTIWLVMISPRYDWTCFLQSCFSNLNFLNQLAASMKPIQIQKNQIHLSTHSWYIQKSYNLINQKHSRSKLRKKMLPHQEFAMGSQEWERSPFESFFWKVNWQN